MIFDDGIILILKFNNYIWGIDVLKWRDLLLTLLMIVVPLVFVINYWDLVLERGFVWAFWLVFNVMTIVAGLAWAARIPHEEPR